MPGIAYVNGAFLGLEDARISVLDRGFLFADGVYEVCAVVGGRLVDFDAHAERLERSLREIDLEPPMPMDALKAVHWDLIAKNALIEGIIYLQMTRGSAPIREFSYPAKVVPSVVLFTQAQPLIDVPNVKTGIALKTVPDIRWARRDIKSVGLLAQAMAKETAKRAGCQEALMVEDGVVTEGASSNFSFISAEGRLVTRPNSSKTLAGCTRKAALALGQAHAFEVEERVFTLAEALGAREAFITSAGTFVMPVVRIDETVIGTGKPGPLTQRLREIYVNYALQQPDR